MTLKFGCVYRHKLTGVQFRIDEIWIRDNFVEGGQSVAVRCVLLDADETTCVVGEAVIARWWPHLEKVGDLDQGMLSAAYASLMRSSKEDASDTPFPWCDSCQSYHHPKNPTCKDFVLHN